MSAIIYIILFIWIFVADLLNSFSFQLALIDTLVGGLSANRLTSNNIVVTIIVNGGAVMEKSATLNLRVNPTLKQDAESVLGRLGIPMSTAVDMFLNQIVLVGGIPFSVTLPNAPESIDMTKMDEDQIHAKIQRGYESYKAGRTQNAAEAFNRFRESHS